MNPPEAEVEVSCQSLSGKAEVTRASGDDPVCVTAPLGPEDADAVEGQGRAQGQGQGQGPGQGQAQGHPRREPCREGVEKWRAPTIRSGPALRAPHGGL